MPARITHGLTRSPEYRAWLHMRERCNHPNDPGFFRYGGRGITVCDRWQNSFENFIEDMGLRPSAKHSLNRINNDGNYEPSNCKWSTRYEQDRNKRGNLFVELFGVELVLADAMMSLKILPHGLYYRVRKFRETPQQAVNHYLQLRFQQNGC